MSIHHLRKQTLEKHPIRNYKIKMTSTGSKDTSMPILDHLNELRRRLIFCFIGIILAFFLCYAFSQNIYNFLVEPLANIGSDGRQRRMIFTGLHEAFFTQVKVAFFGAFFLMFPLIATQIWRFVAPGLYKKEKRAFLPFLLATPILFLLGAVTVYYIVIPIAWEFFVSFEQLGNQDTLPMELEPKVNEYLSLVMGLILAFGICFELPIFLLLATKIGLTDAEGLRKKRKYAILFAFILAAIVTPPDVISQVLLAVPIIILYELSIFFARHLEPDLKETGTSD